MFIILCNLNEQQIIWPHSIFLYNLKNLKNNIFKYVQKNMFKVKNNCFWLISKIPKQNKNNKITNKITKNISRK